MQMARRLPPALGILTKPNLNLATLNEQTTHDDAGIDTDTNPEHDATWL